MSGPGLYYDLQSVQVLKGPQGTLFGRNTTGGAILFEPRRPSLETLEGYDQLLAGDYARGEAQGAINVPVIDGKLAIRVAGQLASRDGYTKDVNTGVAYDNRHFQAARVGILFQPTNAIENYFIANYVAFNERGPGTILIAGNPSNPFIGPGILGYVASQRARGIRRTALDVKELDQGIFYNLINKTSVTLSDALTLRNILSHSRQRIRRQDDEDGTTLALLDSVGSAPGAWLVDQGTTTEEIQLQGKSFVEAFNWQTGAYYEVDDTPNPMNRTYSQQVALLPFYSNSEGIDYGGTSFGLYGQGSYKLAWLVEGLSFTAGYRYTRDRLHERYSQSFDASRTPQAGDFCTSLAGAVYPNCFVYARAKHQGSSYTVGLDYQLHPTILLYLVSRQGYKSGGFNIVAATVGDTNSSAFSYRPETVRDVELGIKVDWSLGSIKGRTNIAVYHSWYRDAQVNTSDLISNLQEAVTENAARATIEGVEIENTLQPNSFTELTLSYSYMDAFYNRYITPLGQDLTGLPYAYAPRNKESVTARIRLPFPGSTGEVWLGANFTYQDRVFAGFSTVDAGSFIPPYGLLGLRVDWEKVFGTTLDASLFATNVANKSYRVANEDLYSTIGTATTVYGEARMWGASLRYRF
jgi:iron complex outermembrane receptor protein